MRWRLLSAGVVAWLVLATPAHAGIGKGNGEIGFDFGGTQFDQDLGGTGLARLALRGGYHATSLFEIEGEASAAFNVTTDHPYGSSRKSLNFENQLDAYFVNGVFNFHAHRGQIVPYVLGGVGIAYVTPRDFGPRDSGEATQLAVGSRFFFGEDDHVAFRVEVSQLWASYLDTTTTHPSFVIGFTWRLGGDSAP